MPGPQVITAPSSPARRAGIGGVSVSPKLGGAFRTGFHKVRLNAKTVARLNAAKPVLVSRVPTASPVRVAQPKVSAPKFTSRPSASTGSPKVGGATGSLRPASMNVIQAARGTGVGTFRDGVFTPPSPAPMTKTRTPVTITAPAPMPVRVAPVIPRIAPAPPQPMPQTEPAKPLVQPSRPIRTPALPDKPRTAPILPDPEAVPEVEKVSPPKGVPFVPPFGDDDELTDRLEKEIGEINKELNKGEGTGDITPPTGDKLVDGVPEPPDDDDDDKPTPIRPTLKNGKSRLPSYGGGIDPCLRLAIQYGRFGVVALRDKPDDDPCVLQLLESLGVTSVEALRRST